MKLRFARISTTIWALTFGCVVSCTRCHSQEPAEGTLDAFQEDVVCQSQAVEGNLLGDSPDRNKVSSISDKIGAYKSVLDTWLAAQLEKHHLPGLAVAVVHDQQVIYENALGLANRETKTPVDPDTLFRIGSLSKLFTSIAVVQLRDHGKLRLDDPVVKYLPWFAVGESVESKREVTIFQLLTHTAGLSSESIGDRAYWTDLQFPSLDELKGDGVHRKLLFEPSEKLKYSNLGMELLGQVVETASGVSYTEYVRQNVLFPIGMEHTEIDVAATHPRLAQGYGPRVGGERSPVGYYSANAATPACGLTSTIRDMEKFLTWQFRVRSGTNDEVLSRRSLQEMQRSHRLSDDMQFGQGLGFWNSKHQASWLVGHGGEMPGFWTCIMIDPDTQLGVVLLANSMYAPVHLGQSESLMDGMFAALKMIDQAPSLNSTDNSKHPEAIGYEGTYRSIWGDLCVRRFNGKLLVFDPCGLNPFSRRYILDPVEIANHRFVAVESTDNYYLQESFVFEDFVDGTAMVLRDPGAQFRRIGH